MPGGVVEPGESIERAALREAQEETGVAADLVHTLAPLTPVDIPVSGFRLHPIVGFADDRPALVPAAGEVARVLEVPVADLLDPDRVTWQTVMRDGHAVRAPGFAILDAHLWGATAMVIAEFLTLLGWAGPRRDPHSAT